MIAPREMSEPDGRGEGRRDTPSAESAEQPSLRRDCGDAHQPRRSTRKTLSEIHSRNCQAAEPPKKARQPQPGVEALPGRQPHQPQQPLPPAKRTQFQVIYSSLMQLNEQIKTISSKVQSFDYRISRLQQKAYDGAESKRKARKSEELLKGYYQCPNKSCRKTYESETSLNLHFKLKHSGSDFDSKIELCLREQDEPTAKPAKPVLQDEPV